MKNYRVVKVNGKQYRDVTEEYVDCGKEEKHMKPTTEFLAKKLDTLNRQIADLTKEYQVVSKLLMEAEDEQIDSDGETNKRS